VGEHTFWGLRIDKDLSPKIGLIYSMLEENRKKTKRLVLGMKSEHLVWQPDPHANTIGTLLLHIAEAELNWMQKEIAGKPLTQEQKEEFRYDIYGSAGHKQIESHHLDFFLRKLDRVRAYTRKVLGRLKDSDLATVHREGKERITNGWILYHLIEHEASHFGQIANLTNRMKKLRLIKPKPQS